MSWLQIFYRFLRILTPIFVGWVLVSAGSVALSSAPEKASSSTNDVSTTSDPVESNENYWFKKGVESYQKKDLDDADKSFEESLKYAKELKPYIHYFQAEILLARGNSEKSFSIYQNVLSETKSPRLRTQVLQKIIDNEIKAKHFAVALATIKKYRRYLMARADRPQLNYFQAQVYKALRDHGKMCTSLKNLYAKYPDYKSVSQWNQDLDDNIFEGAKTGCSATLTDFRERIRNLLWAGLDTKAQGEVEILRNRNKDKNPAIGDSLMAAFFVQEGEIGKAYDLLSPHFEEMKRNPDYMNQLAVAAARKGDSDTAYKIYHYLHTTFPKSKMGRKALFQAAFLSYQFNNYDRAAKSFHEFIQKYPRSGFRKDAEWHLAWLEYLRGNYRQAQILLKKQLGTRRNPEERAQYWLAMAYFRDGNIAMARKLLGELAKDPLRSYYSLAASFRLKSMPSATIPQKTLASVARTFLSARSAFAAIKPSDEATYTDEESGEREQDITSFSVVDEDPRDTDEAADPEEAIEDAIPEISLPAQGDVITRARLFQSLGLGDWARDEIQRFDRKKKDKKFLDDVWVQFSNLHLYYYSSDLARTLFANSQHSHDLEEVRNFYLKTYPHAYPESVEKAAKRFEIKPEFIWAIMRTESQYREEAISPVGALGLMQVMPLTGRKMAEKISLKDFEPSQLLQPDVVIQIGSSYLQRLYKKFDGEIPLAAAAYNAGPHRVKLWVSSIGTRDWDEFIDHIPFVETRNYVKRVVLSYQIYKWAETKELDSTIDLSKPYQFKMTEPVPLRETWEDI